MSKRKPRGRPVLSAAAQIHDWLIRPQLPAGWLELPQPTWDEMVRVAGLLRRVVAKQWHCAGRRLLEDLDYLARQLAREAERISAGLPNQVGHDEVAPASQIAADLLALEQEFAEVAVDLAERQVHVVTQSIELEGVQLGQFRIVLSWQQIGHACPYEIVALSPIPAEADEGVTHPHVRQRRLCPGDGSAAIDKALASGRILDFFMLVERVLETYNAGSAYVPLERWSGVACRDCGWIMPANDHGFCDRCDDPLCGECSQPCPTCGATTCSSCTGQCGSCTETFCAGCLTCGDSGMERCESCLEQPQEPPHETPHQPAAVAAAA